MTKAPTELMTVADFCDRYRTGKTSLYREAAAGRIKLRKFGTATRIAREDAEGSVRATSQIVLSPAGQW